MRVLRGSEREQVQGTLGHFANRGVDGFAYISHASFLVLGQSSALIRDARDQILVALGLPVMRILGATRP